MPQLLTGFAEATLKQSLDPTKNIHNPLRIQNDDDEGLSTSQVEMIIKGLEDRQSKH